MAKSRGASGSAHVVLSAMIQDPYVVGSARPINPVHPVVATTRSGFADGPVSARVAVVDVDGTSGALRPPAIYDPHGSPYRNVGAYRVKAPFVKGTVGGRWVRRDARMPLSQLGTKGYDDAFLKVSAFGTVLRTIGFVEHPDVLGRRVEWAFEGHQLLVVPRAGVLDNAFYHRESRSLQFYSFVAPERPDYVVHTALSEDIVTHETAHALVDGIAPDLYSATDPESLAIHESVADLTAVMLSLRNRELGRRTLPQMVAEVERSSRYSRIAEQFGRSRGQGKALRDAWNARTFAMAMHDGRGTGDSASPYSIAEVLTGALFPVLIRSFRTAIDGLSSRSHKASASEDFRVAALLATQRIGGMVFKALDWLPPGEVSVADFVLAMLAADQFHHPSRPAEREWLVEACVARGIATNAEMTAVASGRVDIAAIAPSDASVQSARRFVAAHRELVGVADGTTVRVTVRTSGTSDEPTTGRGDTSESVELERRYQPSPAATTARLLKASWWTTVPIDLGEEFGTRCEIRIGTTIAVASDGSIVAVLRGGRSVAGGSGRPPFLRRLVDVGTLARPTVPSHVRAEPTHSVIHSTLVKGTLRVHGGLNTLHIADSFD